MGVRHMGYMLCPSRSLFFCLACLTASAFAAPVSPVVSDNDLVMTRQSWGEALRNVSVDGNALTIKGKRYEQGIGSHATSMIPVSVPAGAAVLKGACGVDDEVKSAGSVRFVIMSGSEVLWESGVMSRGMAAKPFAVTVPEGARKLYLLADEVENTDCDHANWVDLEWSGKKAAAAPAERKKVINVAEFGVVPDSRDDQGPAFRKAISAARANPGCTLVIPKGVYHFRPEGALKMSFHISNHDQPTFHPVCLPLVDLENVTVEGNSALFLFHGLELPVLVMDSARTTVNNLSVDYERAYYSEGVVTGMDDRTTTVSIDRKAYPFEINNRRFTFRGDGWSQGVSSCMAFEKGTGHIIEGTSDLSWSGEVEDLGDGECRLVWNLKEKGLKPGDTIVFRTWGRPHPACVLYRADKTAFNRVNLHQSTGMAFLAQRSADIALKGCGVFARKETGRVQSAGADATHFSNTRGVILSENGLYEGMMDDAINVHSTCLSLEKIVAPDTILCRYKHGQAVGFEVFLPGEMLRFIAGPTLEPGASARVKAVRKLNTNELLITLSTPISSDVKPGDAVENGDWYPSVIFRGNTVRNNRARGSLFTTPKKVLVEGNHFDHSSGSAILLAGDAQGWYESGACEDVVIRKNRFTNNLTSRYQFTNAIIAIFPEVRQLTNQKEYYHRNVRIEDNEFNTFDVPLLFAISTKNLVFRNNTIKYNNDFKGWGRKPFEFQRCAGVTITGNKVTPPRVWTIEDCDLKNTPPSEVKIK